MSDIVERLRRPPTEYVAYGIAPRLEEDGARRLLHEAADEIERLTAEVAMWKEHCEAVQADFERAEKQWDKAERY